MEDTTYCSGGHGCLGKMKDIWYIVMKMHVNNPVGITLNVLLFPV